MTTLVVTYNVLEFEKLISPIKCLVKTVISQSWEMSVEAKPRLQHFMAIC